MVSVLASYSDNPSSNPAEAYSFFTSIFCPVKFGFGMKENNQGAVVVAQLVEWSLLIPEVRGLNSVIGKNLYIY